MDLLNVRTQLISCGPQKLEELYFVIASYAQAQSQPFWTLFNTSCIIEPTADPLELKKVARAYALILSQFDEFIPVFQQSVVLLGLNMAEAQFPSAAETLTLALTKLTQRPSTMIMTPQSLVASIPADLPAHPSVKALISSSQLPPPPPPSPPVIAPVVKVPQASVAVESKLPPKLKHPKFVPVPLPIVSNVEHYFNFRHPLTMMKQAGKKAVDTMKEGLTFKFLFEYNTTDPSILGLSALVGTQKVGYFGKRFVLALKPLLLEGVTLQGKLGPFTGDTHERICDFELFGPAGNPKVKEDAATTFSHLKIALSY